MPRVKAILHLEDKGDYAIVHVLLSDGTEAEIYNGGEVEVRFDEKHGKIKAFVKRRKNLT